jgi:DNA-directed RNA polymerase subunit RPC12/RpoP
MSKSEKALEKYQTTIIELNKKAKEKNIDIAFAGLFDINGQPQKNKHNDLQCLRICSKHGEQPATIENVKQQLKCNTTGCTQCEREKNRLKRRLTPEYINMQLEIKGLKLLDSYSTSQEDNWFYREACGHTFKTSINKILHRDYICGVCAGKQGRDISFIKNKAHKDLTVLTQEYSGILAEYDFYCNKCKKPFSDTYQNANKHWERGRNACPNCTPTIICKQRTTESFKKELEEKEIELLCEYTKMEDHHKIKCMVCGHVWYATGGNLINGNRGCPKRKNVNENYLLDFIQQLFPDCKIIYHYPLLSGKHIDITVIFPSEQKIHFEYNGEQHYPRKRRPEKIEKIDHFSEEERWVSRDRDKEKKKEIKNLGEPLIIIPYTKQHDAILPFLVHKLELHNIYSKIDIASIKPDYKKIHAHSSLRNQILEIVEKEGTNTITSLVKKVEGEHTIGSIKTELTRLCKLGFFLRIGNGEYKLRKDNAEVNYSQIVEKQQAIDRLVKMETFTFEEVMKIKRCKSRQATHVFLSRMKKEVKIYTVRKGIYSIYNRQEELAKLPTFTVYDIQRIFEYPTKDGAKSWIAEHKNELIVVIKGNYTGKKPTQYKFLA